jgi:hypothetical protein
MAENPRKKLDLSKLLLTKETLTQLKTSTGIKTGNTPKCGGGGASLMDSSGGCG